MYLTNIDEAPRVFSIGEVHTALRALTDKGLPPARDAAEAEMFLEATLLLHGMDLRDAGWWLFLLMADPCGSEDSRKAAMRWAIDVHALVPRRHDDAIGALQAGLCLVARQLQPSPGMNAYLAARAEELAALEVRRARARPAGLKRLLVHARSMDNQGVVRLPFGITLPTAEVFKELKEDWIALHRFGVGMGDCPAYREALLGYRHLVADGVERGIHRLLDQPGAGSVEPIAYFEHFRCVLGDGEWVDNILARLGTDASGSRQLKIDAAQWLAVLSRLGGWSPARLERLLAREDLLANYPNEFLTAATNAIEHIARRDATIEVRAALTLLRMVRHWSDADRGWDASHIVRRCRGWVAALRRGRDLLWLDECLRALSGSGPGNPAQVKSWSTSVCVRIADDRALARGTLLFLMATRDPRHFLQVTPLIEGMLSLRDEHRHLWRLARGEDERLLRRAGMFIVGIIGGRIPVDGRRTAGS